MVVSSIAGGMEVTTRSKWGNCCEVTFMAPGLDQAKERSVCGAKETKMATPGSPEQQDGKVTVQDSRRDERPQKRGRKIAYTRDAPGLRLLLVFFPF